MELLMRWTHGPRLARAVGLVAVVSLGGCMLVRALQADEPLAFNHKVHVEGEGLECADCHSRWEDAEDPGLPLPAQCALCHSDLDAEKPADRQVASLFTDGRFRATHAGKLPDEVLYSHQQHATRGLECVTCHAQVAQDDGHLAQHKAELITSMDECLACHATGNGPHESDCAACHSQIRADVPPPSHAANWKRYHGTLVRAHADERAERCSTCHAQSSCESCHQLELPQNHDNYWRRRGHGLTASMDRQSCMTCHDTDSCQRCHEDSKPISHTGAFGAPRDNHCLICHEPLRGESCGVCHAQATSHEQATPLPADHLPSMNCRQCHGHGQPLPHVDNGQQCTSCHR